MLKPKVRMWKAQLAAVLLTLLAFAFTVYVLGRIPEGRHPLLVLLLASALSAAYGGLIAGVVSTFLGVALVAYVYEPVGSLYVADPQDQIAHCPAGVARHRDLGRRLPPCRRRAAKSRRWSSVSTRKSRLATASNVR